TALPRSGAEGETATRDVEGVLRLLDRAEEHTQDVLQRINDLASLLGRDRAHLGFVARAIEDEILAARLVPVESMVGPFERMVRDLSRKAGKEARLVLEGGEAEIDRKILELLRDPLMHMLRNSVDHGIEAPDERAVLGKPREGTIRLAARQRAGVVELVLED